ncbi:MAG: 50S ribosomal protein L6 [Pseudomonadota bacterium]
MSRIGKNPVEAPSGVEMAMASGALKVKGKLGELSMALREDLVSVEIDGGKAVVSPRNAEDRRSRAMWGTTRANIQNMVTGVSEGFKKELELVGVGYRAAVQGKTLQLNLGFSHDVNYPIPDGIEMKCEKPTSITITGRDKQQVGQIASEIRGFRPPEPYKGKGVKYVDEQILRKEGKKK